MMFMFGSPCATRPRRGSGHALGVLLGALVIACGSPAPGPTSPSPPPSTDAVPDYTRTPLEFSSDRYLLYVSGGDVAYDGVERPCTPLGVPSVGKWVTTFLWFTRDGETWVGRSRPPYASTLTIRLHRVDSTILGVKVEGTADGYAADEFDPVLGKLNLVFDVERPAMLEGVLSPAAAGGLVPGRLSGSMHGHFAFAGGHFEVATCTSVQFYLEPKPPGPPFDQVGAAVPADGAGAP
jgi:hypothetical protein